MPHVLPYGVERSTEDVDARTRTLRNIRFLLLTRSFKLETSEWSLEPTKTSPRPVALSPARKNPPPVKGIVTELLQTMNTISRNSCQ